MHLHTYTYLFFKHKAKVSKHITNRGSSLKLFAGVNWFRRISQCCNSKFLFESPSNLVHVAVAGCRFSPLSSITQSHKDQRHIWWSKKPSTLCIWRGKTDSSEKKNINCSNIIMGYESIISILKMLTAFLGAKQHRKEVIKLLRLSYHSYSMSSTWKTGSSVSLEKGDWNTAIKHDWNDLFSANKYSCENTDILAWESQTESQTDILLFPPTNILVFLLRTKACIFSR